ncbi:MAG TPA: L,D-transpeptidase family protein [Thermoanaerobaculia bacterium]|nr:L,D-transpeptidase family protein [Thermoanaerobaculia bacterium]
MSSTAQQDLAAPGRPARRHVGRRGPWVGRLVCVLALTVAAPAPVAGARPVQVPTTVGDIQQELRQRFEAAAIDPAALVVGGEALYARAAMAAFYDRRGYLPAWTAGGAVAVRTLVEALRAGDREGLVPEHYHLRALVASLDAGEAQAGDVRALAELDLLATDALLLYAGHLVSGRVDPATLGAEWVAVRREAELVAWLEGVVAGGDLPGALGTLLPSHAGYWGLRAALARYRELAAGGGWAEIPAGEVLDPGGDDPRVPVLRSRLAATGDLAGRALVGDEEGFPAPGEAADGGTIYDPPLVEGVRRFQRRHGLDADGRVGERTLAALNVPAAERVRQIELNLERWRWLPRDLGTRYLLVNIPAFELAVVDRESVVDRMRVIVGRSYRRTPVFSDQVRYIVLNPRWDVPHNLAVRDKLPLIREDSTYLSRMGIRVLSGWGADEVEVDPAELDWSALGRGSFPYHLRQDPGPLNALGRIKFMFPNPFNVYLHDTPERQLFARHDRDFSSGCIRTERPLDLAVRLLAPDGITRAQLESLLETGRESTRVLGAPVPIHVLYWTAFVEAEGTVGFRRDLYQRDVALATALARVPG